MQNEKNRWSLNAGLEFYEPEDTMVKVKIKTRLCDQGFHDSGYAPITNLRE